jgi:RasGEF N-terminal motif
MVSDILSPQESDQYWGVRMPEPVHDAADIVLSEENESLKGASLAALVYMLTDPQPRSQSINDADLQHTFLLCFRSFCDPVNLAKALIARLDEKPVSLNDSQREAWPLYQSLVYVLVARLIETWIDHYWVPEKDRIAGLHIKDFISQEHEQFGSNVRDKIVQKLNEKREVAISLAPSGDAADQSRPEPTVINASVRLACRRKSIRYKDRLQVRVGKLVRRVHQPTPTDEDIQSARTLDDLIGSAPDGQVHILTLNSRELCQELARQLAIFMSEGYRRVIPDDLWFRFGMGYDCDGDTARSAQQAYECALSSWVTASILEQVDANARAAVMTFFIALAMVRSLFRSVLLLLTHC